MDVPRKVPMSASKYSSYFSTKATPQTEPIPSKEHLMAQNNAGGFSFQTNDWMRLDRFLILGNEGGSYYCSEKVMTVDNAKVVLRCLQEDAGRVVQRIVQISQEGRAPKNDPAIFALAMAAGSKGSQQALEALPLVCRTGTHFFQFCEAVEKFRGHGRALNTALKNWYLRKDARDLAYQVTKYQQRNGWSHRDVLRLCRPKTEGLHQSIFKWIVKGGEACEFVTVDQSEDSLIPIWAFERAKKSNDKKEIVQLIEKYNLVRECIPTQFLNEPEVWEALLEKMPMTAMIRNLAKMTQVGLLKPMSQACNKVLGELTNQDRLKKSRVHPIQVLAALKTYAQGHGERGKLTWSPVSQVIDALDGAFYNAFQNVESSGKRWFLGVDVSGSMWVSVVSGIPGLSCGMAAGAMALVTARVEPSWYMAAFHTQMVPFAPSPRQRLDDFCAMISRLPWGGTDCAQPMLHAMQEKLEIDVFVIYTDSESWAGKIHAKQALDMYRQKMGIPAKAICVAMVANEWRVLDPEDPNSLNIAGFDTAVPQVMSEFVCW